MQLGEREFISRVRSLMPEQSEGNNHTSKINVFTILQTIFFLLGGGGGSKMNFLAPKGSIRCTLGSIRCTL